MKYTVLVKVDKLPDDKGNYTEQPGFVSVHVTARSEQEAKNKAAARILPECKPQTTLSKIA